MSEAWREGLDLLAARVAQLPAVVRAEACAPEPAVGFDPEGARALGLPAGRADMLLLGLVAVAAVAAIPAVGALLVTAIYVLPAAAARMLTGTIRGLVACALVLALAEGVVGLYLAYWLDVPPGPPVAVLGATVCLVLGALPQRSAT